MGCVVKHLFFVGFAFVVSFRSFEIVRAWILYNNFQVLEVLNRLVIHTALPNVCMANLSQPSSEGRSICQVCEMRAQHALRSHSFHPPEWAHWHGQ